MIHRFKNLFKSKYEVWIYEKRVSKYYGLCGQNTIRKEVIVTTRGSMGGHYERLFDILKCEKLESKGFKLVKIEIRYL